ncbi:MAG: YHS domain-containing protein [Planctomycetes bacterium]|nr:YHS domain-containing protein [Planctomycetota bacterium]
MSIRSVALGSLVVFVGLVLGVLVLAGCQKEKPAVRQPAKQAAAGEQTTCPVMGNPIDKNIFVEYQGKKVYFCCKGCPDMFRANPEKYLAKLPQFAK